MATATFEASRRFRGTSLADRVLTYINTVYSGRHAAKRLASDADVSPRTAQNWLLGLNGPDAERLVRLMAVHPGLQQQVNDDIALLRRVRASQQQARALLDETNDRTAAAPHRAGAAVDIRHDREPRHAPAFSGAAPSGELT